MPITRFRIIDFFKALKVLPLRLIIELGGFAFNTPNIKDSDSTREWIKALCVTLGKLAELSETDIDDLAVEKMAEIIDHDAAWDALYAIVISVLDMEEPLVPDAQDPRVTGVAGVVGFDPATIIAIITTIIQLLQWFRERRSS